LRLKNASAGDYPTEAGITIPNRRMSSTSVPLLWKAVEKSPVPLKPLPSSDAPLVIRTDFSNQEAWGIVREQIQRPVGLFRASVTFVDNPDFTGLARADLQALGYYDHQTFAILADRITMTHPEHPVLVLFVFEDTQVEFRAIPSEIPGIENNLSLGNMDPEEFAESADADGVFRGF
jgi:hypothetical protein